MNTAKLWRRFELDRLAALLKEGKSIPEIAAVLGRSPGATDSQARKHHLIGPRGPQKGAAYHAARLQGASLRHRGAEATNGQDAPQAGPAGSTRNPKYLRGLIAYNQARLARAEAATGAWAEMPAVDRIEDAGRIAAAIEVLQRRLGEPVEP